MPNIGINRWRMLCKLAEHGIMFAEDVINMRWTCKMDYGHAEIGVLQRLIE